MGLYIYILRKQHYLKGLGTVAFLEEMCDCRCVLKLQKHKPDPTTHSLAAYGSQLLLQDHVCLHAAMLPTMLIMD